jgi:(2Fe-2S) ferredoxin
MADEHDHCAATPYEQSEFRVLDKVRYHVFVCIDGKDFCGCEGSGSGALLAALRRELVMRRLMPQVKINIMQCRQQGITGPVLVVHPDGVWYEGLKPENVTEFVEQQILQGRPLSRFVMRSSLKPVTAVPAHIAAGA